MYKCCNLNYTEANYFSLFYLYKWEIEFREALLLLFYFSRFLRSFLEILYQVNHVEGSFNINYEFSNLTFLYYMLNIFF